MKILIITPVYPPEIGGPATYTTELEARLSKNNTIKVTGFGSALVPTTGGPILRQLRLFLSCIVNGWDKNLFYLQDPLVTGLTGILAGKILGKKILLKYVGDPVWENLRSRGSMPSLSDFLANKPRNISSLITGFVLRHSDSVVVPANHLKALLVNYYGVSPDKVIVIVNSVNVSGLKLRKNPGQIIFVGRLVKWKNIDLILEAISRVAKSINVTLKIIGDGPEKKSLIALTKRLGLERQVIFMGKLTHELVLEEQARSELLALYSDYEGLPHVALEALSVGTVPILSKIPGNDEISVARLVSPNDPTALSEEIKSTLTNRRQMESLSKKARIEARQTYAWEKNIDKLEDLFRSFSSSRNG